MASFGMRRLLGLIVALGLGVPLQAQERELATPPGFRPESPHAAHFLETLDDAAMVVLPTIVRGTGGVDYSLASQRLIVASLDEWRVSSSVTAADLRIDLGPAPHESQWDLFHSSLGTVAASLGDWPRDAEYVLVMEVVLAPRDRAVFGIHSYILDGKGRNAFSFLLNAHHEAFAAADLVAEDDTEKARRAMIVHATRVGVAALKAQVDHAKACGLWMAANPAQPMAVGVFEDFEDGLPAVQDAHSIPLGFSTFSDGRSTVFVDTTSTHPPRPGEEQGNRTLEIDMDVTGWAGFAYLVHDAVARTWRPQDWTGFEGLTFWMYGRDTGTRLFVDVLDNRKPCSVMDDAERYVYEFVDDFSGWKQIFIRFDEMNRKEIGNGAPDDGLGLARVHGWAWGSQVTEGPKTWYLDDFALWRSGPG